MDNSQCIFNLKPIIKTFIFRKRLNHKTETSLLGRKSTGLQAVGQAIECLLFRLAELACPTAPRDTTQKEGGTAVGLHANHYRRNMIYSLHKEKSLMRLTASPPSQDP